MESGKLKPGWQEGIKKLISEETALQHQWRWQFPYAESVPPNLQSPSPENQEVLEGLQALGLPSCWLGF